jgi:membrane protein/epoxyqueuosine reductase
MPIAKATGKGESIQRRWVKTRDVLRQALVNFLAEDSLMVSASIAYHSLLAIFPLLLLLLGLTGLYIRHFELAGHLSVVLQRYLPVRTDIIMQNLVGISRAYGRIGLISFLLLLWSSSGVFVPLEKALNRAWDVPAGRRWWESRLLALEMAFIVGSVILIAAAFVGVEIYFRARLSVILGPSLHPLVIFLYRMLTAISSFSAALLTFVVVFERLPNRPMGLRQALPGALLTALLWETARWLFTIFLPFFNYRHVYGSIGVVVSFMTWAYISSAVILFGAQVSHALYGSLKLNEMPRSNTIPIANLKGSEGDA